MRPPAPRPPAAAPASTTTTDAGTGDTASSLANAKVGDKISGKTLADAMSAAFKDGTSGHMSMDMGGSITAEGDFQVADGKQNSTMTMEVAGSKMEMISVGGKTYMKSPMFAGGTKWVSMDSATVMCSPTKSVGLMDTTSAWPSSAPTPRSRWTSTGPT